MQAIASHVSTAIRTAEVFGELAQHAYEDPLTGLANRRALDDRLRECYATDVAATLLVGDVDGLKLVNDRDGHPAGDALLRDVAGVLSAVASTVPDALVARLGGDEFCLLLPDSTLADAERLARQASRQLANEMDGSVSLCWGAAARDAQLRTGHELIAAADIAMVTAKREGPARIRLRTDDLSIPASWPARRTPRGRGALDHLIPHVVAGLDMQSDVTVPNALAFLAGELCRVIDATGWATSMTNDRGDALVVLDGVVGRLNSDCPLRLLEPFDDSPDALADYPVTAHALRSGSWFTAAVEDAGSDPAEVACLRQLGQRAVLGCGARGRRHNYLLEVYCDDGVGSLQEVAPHATVLMHYCVSRYDDV